MKQKTVNQIQSEPAPINNMFVNTLQEFREGESIAELSEALQALVCAVQDTGKKGELTYKIKITPHGDAVVLVDEIKVKAPEMDRESAIFFAGGDGVLQRDNPAQRKLDFKEVPVPERELKEVQRPAVSA